MENTTATQTAPKAKTSKAFAAGVRSVEARDWEWAREQKRARFSEPNREEFDAGVTSALFARYGMTPQEAR